MINGISGKPGGGKSYEAVVSHIIPVVRDDKRKVVTNLPLNIDHFCNVYGEYCRDLIEVIDGQFHNYGGERPFSKKDHYLQYEDWENEKGQKVYFFIDECHLSMPTTGTEKELTEFFSMHRHFGFDIMLITQNFRKVNRDIRDMVQNGYRAIKKSMMGQDDKYILKVHDGASASTQSVVATHERSYEKKYFPFYQSHTKSDKSIVEADSKDIAIWWQHWTIKASAAFFIVGFLILSTKLTASSGTEETLNIEIPDLQEPIFNNKTTNANVPNSSPVAAQQQEPELPLTNRQKEFKEMVEKSKSYHPFYKLTLSISGYSEYLDVDRRVKVHYFSAAQNGQHIFELKTADLLRAGYDIRVLTDCAVSIKYYDFEDFITCDSPRQGVKLNDQELVASN